MCGIQYVPSEYLLMNELVSLRTEVHWKLGYLRNPKSPDVPFRGVKSLVSLAVGSFTFLGGSHLPS